MKSKVSFCVLVHLDVLTKVQTNAHVYGWAHPLQCDNMEWGGSHNNFRKVSRAQGGEYEVEHILEWQTVC